MKDKLTTIGKAFRLPGEIFSFDTIKNGNINTTYRVDYTSPNKSYVFQKINTYVFKDPVHAVAGFGVAGYGKNSRHRMVFSLIRLFRFGCHKVVLF